MERLDFDLLFRWFVGLGIDDPVWDHSTFSKNRDRLLAGDIAAEFLAHVAGSAQVRRLLSSEHFSVDGSLVEAWASMKSFRPKDEPGEPPTGGRNGEPRLPRRAARQRQPRLDHRSRCPALPQGPGPGGEALLRRTCTDGEPARPRGRCRADPRLRTCRAAGGAGHARPAADRRPDDPRRRPRLRRPGLRHGAARAPGDPAHRPEHQRPALGDRSPDDAPSRLRREPAGQKAHRGSVRLDQDHRRSGEDQAARPRAGALVVHARGRRLQPGAPAQADRGDVIMLPRPAAASIAPIAPATSDFPPASRWTVGAAP